MELAYDGRQVVGMDLHRQRSVLVRMTEDGRRLGGYGREFEHQLVASSGTTFGG